jgi:hypothetical protein
MSGARIESPEVIKAFRPQLIRFDEACHHAVTAVRSDMHRATQWLRQEQMNHWKRELRKSEELVIQCRIAYTEARYGAPQLRKNSAVDEKKALERAIRRKEECDQKLAATKRWAMILEQQAEKLMAPIDNLAHTLDAATPKALSKLDQLVENLEEYMKGQTG